MFLSPLIQRELLVTARKRSTPIGRCVSATIALVIFVILLASHRSNMWRLGPDLLEGISLFAFIEAMVAGTRYTCDCVSEEKREGTLGLLFLTDMSGLEVVFGKLVTRSLGAVYNLIATLPVFWLCILVGGVSGSQVLAVTFLIFTTTLLSLSAGIFVSSRGTHEKSVLLGSILLMASIALFPMAAWWSLHRFFPSSALVYFLPQISPIYDYKRSILGITPEILGALVVLFSLTVGFVLLASFRLERAFREFKSETGVARRKRQLKNSGRGLFWQNPIEWLALKQRSSSRGLTFFCSGLLVFGVIGRLLLDNGSRGGIPIIIFGSYALHAFYKFMVVAESARQLNHDKRSGALELILSTPIPPQFVISGILKSTRKYCFMPAVCLSLMNLCWMTNHDFFRDIGVFLPCSIILILTDTMALIWRGMANAMRGDRFPSTVFRTYFEVMLLPLAAFLLFFAFQVGVRSFTLDEMRVFVIVWALGCIAYDVVIFRRSRAELSQFRALASGDYFQNSSRRRKVSPSLLRPIQGSLANRLT